MPRRIESEKSNVPRVRDVAEVEREIAAVDLNSMPSSTLLPANELFLMRQMGLVPIQVVYGNFVYSMGLGGVFRSLRGALNRGELPAFTQMNNDARVIARDRMLEAAKQLGADTVVIAGVEVKELADLLEVTCTGTAFRRAGPETAEDFMQTPGSVQVAVGT